ncbi:hypothetical protein KCU65_g5816, partial [Aureobasidium melanogenum]
MMELLRGKKQRWALSSNRLIEEGWLRQVFVPADGSNPLPQQEQQLLNAIATPKQFADYSQKTTSDDGPYLQQLCDLPGSLQHAPVFGLDQGSIQDLLGPRHWSEFNFPPIDPPKRSLPGLAHSTDYTSFSSVSAPSSFDSTDYTSSSSASASSSFHPTDRTDSSSVSYQSSSCAEYEYWTTKLPRDTQLAMMEHRNLADREGSHAAFLDQATTSPRNYGINNNHPPDVDWKARDLLSAYGEHQQTATEPGRSLFHGQSSSFRPHSSPATNIDQDRGPELHGHGGAICQKLADPERDNRETEQLTGLSNDEDSWALSDTDSMSSSKESMNDLEEVLLDNEVAWLRTWLLERSETQHFCQHLQNRLTYERGETSTSQDQSTDSTPESTSLPKSTASSFGSSSTASVLYGPILDGKRRRDDESGQDEQQNKKNRSAHDETEYKPTPRLACLFNKYDPMMYRLNAQTNKKFEICGTHDFQNMNKLYAQGVLVLILEALKSFRRTKQPQNRALQAAVNRRLRKCTDEEKWRFAYQWLFPDTDLHDTPCPYLQDFVISIVSSVTDDYETRILEFIRQCRDLNDLESQLPMIRGRFLAQYGIITNDVEHEPPPLFSGRTISSAGSERPLAVTPRNVAEPQRSILGTINDQDRFVLSLTPPSQTLYQPSMSTLVAGHDSPHSTTASLTPDVTRSQYPPTPVTTTSQYQAASYGGQNEDQDYDQQFDKAEENEIAQLLHQIDFEQLGLRASSVRNNIPCRVEMPKNDKDSRWSMMGGMNIHVRVIFEDKVCWLARIRRSNATSPPPELRDRIFMSEIQTLLFLQETNIPTPKVWDYALEGSENPVRVGYILMDCMPGKSLDQSSPSEEGRNKIIAQIADIYIQLRKFSFDGIGSIEQADDEHVGPLARECFTDFTDSGIRPLGPFSDLQSYYKASIQLLLDLIHRGEIHVDRPVDAYLLYKYLYEIVPELYPDVAETGTKTYLKHADDKGSHILVDEEMNITGIIDWEWAFTTTERLAFNSPMLLLPTWDFFQGLSQIGEEEELFAKCLEAKGAFDMAKFDINHFLAEVQQNELEESSVNGLTLVHSLNFQLWGPTKALRGNNETLQSPFKGCTYLEIHEKLKDMVAATDSSLETEWFLVLDEDSVQTSTAVIVRIESDGEVQSVRAEHLVCSVSISAASVAHAPLDEMIEIANDYGAKDGVIRVEE